jgi:hypothetical protein
MLAPLCHTHNLLLHLPAMCCGFTGPDGGLAGAGTRVRIGHGTGAFGCGLGGGSQRPLLRRLGLAGLQ